MQTETYSALFESWLDQMGIDVDSSDWAEKAGRLLGKSPRMVAYYREGREIPRDTLLLMEALRQGFRPKVFGQQ